MDLHVFLRQPLIVLVLSMSTISILGVQSGDLQTNNGNPPHPIDATHRADLLHPGEARDGQVVGVSFSSHAVGASPGDHSRVQKKTHGVTIPKGPVSFQTVAYGALPSSGYTQPAYFVINDNSEWAAVWARLFCTTIYPCPPVPNIDFARNTVLATFLGTQHNGCCWITVASVESTKSGIVVNAETHVLSNCTVTQAFNFPYDIVAIPRTTQQVIFTNAINETVC